MKEVLRPPVRATWYAGRVSVDSQAGNIAVLESAVVDQIAAGEVVERPASVVKELVENALDAGARHIAVEVDGGGKRLIRVVDDGCGMSAEEARLALRRHATSKLRVLDDLQSLLTMGFRGEALPSIAAVSRLTLTTRARGAVAGVQLVIDAGRVVEQREVGAAVGTVFEVCDLLGNVPARLKFLKGDATESSHITDAVSKLAMAHPEVHFRLTHGKRTTIDAPPHPDGYERARALLGSRFSGRLHRAAGEENGIEVEAYLAAPDLAMSTSRGVQLYVGRRAVRDRGLMHAIVMGYGELLPRGRYPVAVAFVRVPAPDVDVNVHPQKLEVRFSDAQRVYAAVRHTVMRAVGSAPWLAERAPPGSAPVRMRAIADQAPPSSSGRASDLAVGYAAERERMLLPFSRRRGSEAISLPREVRRPSSDSAPPARPAASEGRALNRGSAVSPLPAPAPTAPAAAPTAAPAPVAATFFGDLRYLSQLDRTYLLCELPGELVLVDQHAAHERVAFQRLRERFQQRSIPVQRLLFPQRIELSPDEAAIVDDHADDLAAVGFELEPFGGAHYAVKAVPTGLRGADPEAVLRELLGDLSERGGSRAVDERLDLVLATIACHSVVRAGDALSTTEAEALLASMDDVDFKGHCPHGRPVLLRISVAEIARRFGR